MKACIAALLMVPAIAWAGPSAGRPEVRAFSSKEIGARGPVYAFASGSDNSLFVGSECLSVFDGIGWKQIDLPGSRAFRALAAADEVTPGGYLRGRVWVGGIDALGYVENDRTGRRRFVSLLPELKASGLALGSGIWFAAALGPTALFVTSHQVLRWDGVRFTERAFAGDERLRAFSAGGDVWVWNALTGLWRFGAGGEPVLLRSAADFPSGVLQWLLPPVGPPDKGALDGALVGTDRGAFRLTAAGAERLPALSVALAGLGAVSAAAIDDGSIAIATTRGGVILSSRAGTVSGSISRASGLRDDTVYGLWSSPHLNLWVGLEDGFDRLTGLGRAWILDDRVGLAAGSPRKVCALDGALYAVTTKAIYAVPRPDEKGRPFFTPLVAFNPVFNDAVVTSDGLWVGGAGGLWLVRQGAANHEWRTNDAVVRVAALPGGAPGVIYVEDSRIKMLTRRPSGGPAQSALGTTRSTTWQSSDLGLRIRDLPVSLLTDPAGDLWLSTVSAGIFRYHATAAAANAPASFALAEHFVPGNGLPPVAVHPALTLVGSRLFAFTDSAVLRFSEPAGFRPAPEFAGWTGVAGASVPAPAGALAAAATAYWIVQRLGFGPISPYSLLRVREDHPGSGPVSWQPLRLTGGDHADEIGSIDVTAGPLGPSIWIGRKQSLLHLVETETEFASSPMGVQMRGVRTGAGQKLELDPPGAMAIGPGVRQLVFDFSAAQSLELGVVFYQTRLEGAETAWSAPRSQTTAEYAGLAPGAYVFAARRIDRYGRIGPVLRYPFVVATPWYRRWPAQLGFLALALATAAYFVRRRIRRLHDQTVWLDRLVADRTRQLELSNTAKSDFLDTICHEIRNPLNGIVGLIGMLEDGAPQDARERFGHSLKECAAGLSAVFDEVLNFSRLEAGEVELQPRPFLAAELLGAVRAMFLDAAVQHGAAISLRIPPDFEDGFVGDESKIRTVVNNFVTNALKYAPGSPLVLAVSAAEQTAGQADLLIEVIDSGPGVPEAEQELIFKKFVRGSGARASEIMGTGVGLATCRALAKKLGGSVGIESPGADGRGATFFLKLVLARLPAAMAARGAAAVPETGERALVVEDKEYNRIVLAEILHRLGYRTEFAGNGEQARAAAARQSFELILLDLDLPGITGPELARQLQGPPGTAPAVVIGTSGRSSPRTEQMCRDAGMSALVVKPLTLESIRGAIDAARRDR